MLKINQNTKTLLSSVSIVTIFFTAAPALAQTSPADSDSNQALAFDEIIVTARKKEESIQDVPLSISAFTSADIAEKSLTELEDVALLTPGLNFEDFSNGGYGSPNVRGATQLSLIQLEQNVSVFLDGVYIPRQYAFDLGLINLDRIEVVKGPQSALYGSNAFAGAINYVTNNEIADEFGLSAQVDVSEDKGFDFSGRVDVPVMEDVLSVRLAGGIAKFGGGTPNNHPNADVGISPGTDGNLGGRDNYSVQAGFTANPLNNLTVKGDYYLFDISTEAQPQFRLSKANGDTNCNPQVEPLFPGAPPFLTATRNQLFCGELSSTPIPGPSGTEGISVDPRTYGLEAETEVFRGELGYSVNDNIDLNYTFSKISGEAFSAGGADRDAIQGTSFTGAPPFQNIFTYGPVGDFDYTSHELRAEFDLSDNISLMVGGFLQDGEDFDNFTFAFSPLLGTDPITELPPESPFGNTGGVIRDVEVNAVFARGEFGLLDGDLVFGVEGRYTDEQKVLTAGNVALNTIPAEGFKYTDSYFTPRFSVDYKLGDNSLLFASMAKGVKSGGINGSSPGLIDDDRFYGPDENWTYEIGTKNTLLNGRARLNATAFYIDWTDLQNSVSPTGATLATPSIIQNLGAATSKGLEVDGSISLNEYLTLDAGLALIDAEYEDGVISRRVLSLGLCDDIVCRSNGEIGGNDLPRYSDYQWNVGGSFEIPVSNKFDFFTRVDFAGQSEQYISEINVGTIQPRSLLNLRAGVRNDNWSASIWARNALNEEYVSNAFYIVNGFQNEVVPSLGAPRRVGVTLSYKH